MALIFENLDTKYFALLLLVISPTIVQGQSDGPVPTDFSNYVPSSASQMVDEFSGDFSYTIPLLVIPGPNGMSYPLTLGYNSGIAPEQNASWVGLGWTLSPGAIVRSKRGFPDDYKASNVKYWNKVPMNWSASMGFGFGVEYFSNDFLSGAGGINASLIYNNYRGFGYSAGIKMNGFGMANLDLGVTNGEFSFKPGIQPMRLLGNLIRRRINRPSTKPGSEEKNKRKARNEKNRIKNVRQTNLRMASSANRVPLSFGTDLPATNTVELFGATIDVQFSVQGTPGPTEFGIGGDIFGNYNFQKPVEEDILEAYGYMYSGDVQNMERNPNPFQSFRGQSAMMDYYAEMETPFTKRKEFLSVPFNSADNFTIMGENTGGSFRLHHRNIGAFRPNLKTSAIFNLQLGGDLALGLDIGGGATLSFGGQVTVTSGWNDSRFRFTGKEDQVDEPYFFKLHNDLAGAWVNPDIPNTFQAGLKRNNLTGVKLFDKVTFKIEPVYNGLPVTINEGLRCGRSTFIGFNTNREISEHDAGKSIYAYNRRELVNQFVRRSGGASNPVSEGIGEMTVVNEDGSRYVYGLPVYSRNEIELQYGLSDVPASGILSASIAYRNINSTAMEVKVGEERNTPYATAFLLTEITSPDYVDRNMDGPTPDDLGTYILFNYKQHLGTNRLDYKNNTNDSWYNWRSPYTGLHYDMGSLSDPLDDLGTVHAGEKEIYYIESIETKTHLAEFITSPREDGLEAPRNDIAAGTDDPDLQNLDRLEKLDRIDLYVKNANGQKGKLIKSVVFEYDYSLSPGVPNNSQEPVDVNGDDPAATGLSDVNANAGKLTLKRLWFEYDSVVPARITPYEFGYTYKTHGYPAKYADFDNYGGADLIENPAYDVTATDAWGNYQPDGADRAARFLPGIDQTPDYTRFDPAAWHLKQIILPSRGEIHVQYEQDEYNYVQNKRAMALVSLKPASNDEAEAAGPGTQNKYYLNLEDLGLTPTGSDLQRYRSVLQSTYVVPNERIYFKFLYALAGLDGLGAASCNIDYIRGYAPVRSVGTDAEGLFIILGDQGGDNTYSTPRKVCLDFVKNYRIGKLLREDCSRAASGFSDEEDAAESNVNHLLANMGSVSSLFSKLRENNCLSVDFSNSYLRIPLLQAKKGGGVRVKRLLQFDKGIEPGDTILYGVEYHYTTKNERGETLSSGVATNEPSREENPLIDFNSKRRDLEGKAIAGDEADQAVGLIGESLLPSPSVGYSRVIARGIHQGRTKAGFAVSEYHTVKEHPSFAMEATGINDDRREIPIPLYVVNLRFVDSWESQGYTFKMNRMHGQVKMIASYGGDYENEDSWVMSSHQEFEYFDPYKPLPVKKNINDPIHLADLGVESDITIEGRQVFDSYVDVNVEFDVSVGLIPVPPPPAPTAITIPVPYVSAMPFFNMTQNVLHSTVASKVVRYPVMVKKIISSQDGIQHKTEYLAFDATTGRPVLTKTSDGFNNLHVAGSSLEHDGTYHTYTYLGHQEYDGMRPKAINEGSMVYSQSDLNISKEFDGSHNYIRIKPRSGTSICNTMDYFHEGDLVTVRYYDASDDLQFDGIYQIDKVAGNTCRLIPTTPFSHTNQAYTKVAVEVLRSGLANQLTTTIGGISTYGEMRTPFKSQGDPIEIQKRRNFVNRLNDALASKQPLLLKGNEHPIFDFTAGDINEKCILKIQFIDLGNDGVKMEVINVNDKITECSFDFNGNGIFDVDPTNGMIVYYLDDNACHPQEVPCIRVCPVYCKAYMDGVLVAHASDHKQEWANDSTGTRENPYETASLGKWHLEGGQLYKTSIIGGGDDAGGERNYHDAGVFDEFTLYNFRDPEANDPEKWLNNARTTEYNPHGIPLEQTNAQGLNSITDLVEPFMVPNVSLRNASRYSFLFESFEKDHGNRPGTGHTGNNCLAMTAGQSSSQTIQGLRLTDQLQEEGLLVKVWAMATTTGELDQLLEIHLSDGSGSSVSKKLNKVVKTGEWTLLETYLPPTELNALEAGAKLLINFTNHAPQPGKFLIDDLKAHSIESLAECFVYDFSTMRLIASLNQDHFASYFQYNAQGDRNRTLVETIKGIRMISEDQYNARKVMRAPN